MSQQTSQGTYSLAVPLPLTHPIYHILLVLAAGQQHGYGLRREIVTATEGRMRVGSGSLYRSLDVMLAAGFIGEMRGTIDDMPTPRRIFRLTDLGERIARAETERLVQLVALAGRIPRLSGGGVEGANGTDSTGRVFPSMDAGGIP